jgi:anti-sigma factor RsiW
VTLRRWWQRRRLLCPEVGRVLQQYLDHELDENLSRRVHEHLEHCRRCGLEASAYDDLKDALRRRATPMRPEAAQRLRDFASSLVNNERESGHPAD